MRTSFTVTGARRPGAWMVSRVVRTGCQPAPGRQFIGEWIVSPCRWLW